MSINPYEPPKIDPVYEKPRKAISPGPGCPLCGEPTHRWNIVNANFSYRCKSCGAKLCLELSRDIRAWMALSFMAFGLLSIGFDRTAMAAKLHIDSIYIVFFMFFLGTLFVQWKFGILTAYKK